jgi:ATP-dependent protease ClpP protease subunit
MRDRQMSHIDENSKQGKIGPWTYALDIEGENSVLDLTLYGIIGDDGVYSDIASDEIAKLLSEVRDVKKIRTHINSIGGEVFAGISIYNQLEAHPARVESIVEGQAASSASVIAMAGRTKMMRGAMLYLHNPWTIAIGNSEELRKMADELDQVGDSMVQIYQAKTKMSRDELRSLLAEERYVSAVEAKELGFASHVQDQEITVEPAPVADSYDVNGTRYPAAKVPRQIMAMARPSRTEAKKLPASKQKKEGSMPMETIDQLQAQAPGLWAKIEAIQTEAVQAAKDEATKAERERIQAIEEIAKPGHEKIVAAAKFEKPITAEVLAVQIIKAEREHGEVFLAKRSEELGKATKVKSDPDSVQTSDAQIDEQEIEAQATKLAEYISAAR